MSILASIDIDDQGTEKIQRFTDALLGLDRAAKQASESVTQSGQRMARSTNEQTNAIDRLTGGSAAHEAALGRVSTAYIAQSIASLAAARALDAYVKASFAIASRNEVLATDMGIVAKNTNQSSVAFAEQVAKIRALGITTKDATEAVISFAQASLKMSDSSRLARAAQDLATIAGMNSSQAFHTLTIAIEEQYPRLLRQFGIVSNLNEVYGKYAMSISKTVGQMDAQDKRQAMLNLIMDEAQKVSGAYEASMADVGKALLSTERYQEELSNKLGQAFLPTMKMVVDWLNRTLGALADLPKAFFDVAAGVSIVVGTLVTLGGAIGSLKTAIALFGEASAVGKLLSVVLGTLTGPWGLIAIGIAAAVGALVTWNALQHVSIDQMRDDLATAAAKVDSWHELNNAVFAASKAVQDYAAKGATPSAAAQKNLYDATMNMNKAFPESIAMFNASTGVVIANTKAYNENFAAVQRNYSLALTQAQQELPKLKAQQADLQKQLADAQEADRRERETGSKLTGAMGFGAGNPLAELGNDAYLALFGKRSHDLKSKLDEVSAQVQIDMQIIADRTSKGIADMEDKDLRAIEKLYGKDLDEVMARAKLKKKDLYALANDTGDFYKQTDQQAKMKEGITAMVGAYDEIMKERAKIAAEKKKIDDLVNDDPGGILKIADRQEASKMLMEAAAKGVAEYQRVLIILKPYIESITKVQDDLKDQYPVLVQAMHDLPLAEMTAKLQPLEKELSTLTRGTEAYTAYIKQNEGAINTLKKATPGMVSEFHNVAVAMEDLTKIKLNDKLAAMDDQIKSMTERLSVTIADMNTKTQDGMIEASRKADATLEEDRIRHNEALQGYDDTLFDHTTALFQNETEKKITANDRFFRSYAEGIQKEIDLVNRQNADAQAQIDRTYELEVNAWNKQIDLDQIGYAQKIDALEKFVDLQTAIKNGATQEDIDQREKDIQATFDTYRAQGLAIYQSEKENSQRILDRKKADDAVYLDALKGNLAKGQEAHKISQDVILRDSNIMYRTLKEHIGNYVDTITNGLGQIIGSTQGFKTIFIGIWTDIKNTLLSIMNQTFSAILKGLLGLGASGQTGMAGIVSGFREIGMASLAHGATGAGGAAGSAGAGASTGAATAASSAVMAGMLTAGAGLGGGMIAERIAEKYLGAGKGAAAIGAIGGAGAGALAGAQFGSIGGPVGMGIGAVAGLAYGVYRSQKNDAAKQRGSFLSDLGFTSADALRDFMAQNGQEAQGNDLFNRAANVIGRHDAAGNAAWMKDVAAALDKITTSKAWDELTKAHGNAAELDKQMQLVGLSMSKLKMAVDAGDVKSVTDQTNLLNKALDEQKTRLEGLGQAASGLSAMGLGFGQGVTRNLTDIFNGLSDEDKKKISDAQAGGSTASNLDLMKAQANPETAAKIAGVAKNAQAELSRMGVIAAGVFAGILKDTGSIVQAMDAISPALDQMIPAMDQLGLKADGAFGVLLDFRKVVNANQDVANSLTGITQVLGGLSKAGLLTKDEFMALGQSASAQMQTLKDRNVDANTSAMLMQPTLQALWEAEQKFGFTADDATQALIDQGVQAGTVGPKMQDVNERILGVLLKIADALSTKIPGAFDTAAGAAAVGAGDITGSINSIPRNVDVNVNYISNGQNGPGPGGGSHGGPDNWGRSADDPDWGKDPSAANEGFVSRPMRVMVGDAPGEAGEWILHDSTVRKLLDGRGQSSDSSGAETVDIHVHTMLDGREIARSTVRHIPGEVRRLGLTKY